MITISLQPTMGVAWHRFLAFFNIFLKRHADGRTSLGALQPIAVGGEPVDFENIEDLDEDAALGVGKVEDFTWKGLLDFTTCTECGRCQSQCPAWNTDKPLSPKLLVMALRDHAHAKAPWLLAAEDDRDGAARGDQGRWPRCPWSGDTGYDIRHPLAAYNPHGPDAVIDQDVLWSCTTCGACVEQCPVDIEHVDAIVDMRRYQVLIESAFPAELDGLFKNLENKGNPWGMAPAAAPRLGQGPAVRGQGRRPGRRVADEVDYLFWVGCAGAYEDRAKKTTRAVAELLDTAGVTLRRPRRRRDLHRRLGPPRRQRVPLPDARPAERRDPQRGRRDQDRRHLRALLQHDQERVPPARRQATRSSTTPSCSTGSSARRGSSRWPARPTPTVARGRRLDRGDGDLPRPVLPRPAQRRLRPAARAASARCPASSSLEMERTEREVVLLRRRRRPHVDGGEARHPDQHQPHRGGRRHRRRPDRHRLPVLPGDALRRPHRQAVRRRGPRGGRGRRRRPDAARRRPPRRRRPAATRTSTTPAPPTPSPPPSPDPVGDRRYGDGATRHTAVRPSALRRPDAREVPNPDR